MAENINEAADVVAGWLRLFFEPGDVTELRALAVSRPAYRKPHTEAGFYDHDHLRDMAYDALRLTPHARGVYFVMNPLRPEILARRANRAEPAASQELACDKDVRVRRWILVDCDPVRDPLVSATDAEKGLARQTADAVRVYLAEMNWPEPIVADSGNGFHLFYRRGLPADDGGDVRRTLTLLANRFDTPAVKVDRKVFNPSRIVKLPGTWARKGDDVPGRPHRRSRLLWVPGVGDVVPPATVPVNDAEVP